MNRKELLAKDLEAYTRERGKVAVLSYPPRWLTIGIIGACSFHCRYCIHNAKEIDDHPALAERFKRIPFSIKLPDFKRLVDVAYEGRIPKVHVCATGEPFLHKEIFPMLDYVIARYGKVSTQTDFSKRIFTQTVVDELVSRARNLSYITTDIASADKTAHEAVKIGSDFDFLMETIEYLSHKGGVFFNISHVLTKKDSRNLVEIPRMLKKKRIEFRFSVFNLFPYGINDFTDVGNLFTDEDDHIKKELKDVAEYCQREKIQCNLPVPSGYARCLAFWDKIQTMPLRSTQNHENWYGETACNFCNAFVHGGIDTLGNIVAYDNMMNFWNNTILVGIRETLLSGEYPTKACAACSYVP